MHKLAVFDLCDTLYKSNTTFDFIRFIKPTYSKVIFSFPARILNKTVSKFFEFDLIRFLALISLRGYSEDQLKDLSELFFEEFLVGKELSEPMQLLNSHGSNVVIISASIDPIVKVVANKLGVDYLSSQLSYVDGFCTGKLSVDMLGKKVLYVSSEIGFVVTDNRSDLSLVLQSDSAVIVSKEKNLSFWKSKLRPQDRIIEV